MWTLTLCLMDLMEASALAPIALSLAKLFSKIIWLWINCPLTKCIHSKSLFWTFLPVVLSKNSVADGKSNCCTSAKDLETSSRWVWIKALPFGVQLATASWAFFKLFNPFLACAILATNCALRKLCLFLSAVKIPLYVFLAALKAFKLSLISASLKLPFLNFLVACATKVSKNSCLACRLTFDTLHLVWTPLQIFVIECNCFLNL